MPALRQMTVQRPAGLHGLTTAKIGAFSRRQHENASPQPSRPVRSRTLERHPPGEPAPGRPRRADRLGELRQPRGADRAGQPAHQQVRRGLSRQALLRRLRVRRHRRDARHRAREEAVRRAVGERAAALGLAGEPGGVHRGAQAGRHDPRHVARAGRPPDARLAGQPVRQALSRRLLRPRTRRKRSTTTQAEKHRHGGKAEADRHRRLGLLAARSTGSASAPSPTSAARC